MEYPFGDGYELAKERCVAYGKYVDLMTEP
jgi:hypothetical protein